MVRAAQAAICGALAPLDERPFQEDAWRHPEGGGGLSRVLQDGTVFEKAGVNVAAVDGELHPEALAAHDRQAGSRPRLAPLRCGGALCRAPPAIAAGADDARQLPYFELGDGRWLVRRRRRPHPVLPVCDDDARHFHRTLKAACDAPRPGLLPALQDVVRRLLLPAAPRRDPRRRRHLLRLPRRRATSSALLAFVARRRRGVRSPPTCRSSSARRGAPCGERERALAGATAAGATSSST